MATHDIDQINALVKRLDDLCREASEIRTELGKTARHPVWPAPLGASSLSGKSYVPREFLPISSVRKGAKN
jgi:hypothetical protein